MKTRFIRAIAIISMLLSLALPVSVAAANNVFSNSCESPAAKASAICSNGQTTTNPLVGPNGLLVKVTHLIGIAGGVVAVIIIILAGLRYMLSSGDAPKATAARNTVFYALAGLIIIIVAQTIISFVISKL